MSPDSHMKFDCPEKGAEFEFASTKYFIKFMEINYSEKLMVLFLFLWTHLLKGIKLFVKCNKCKKTKI